jgi:hypothetical protein
MTIDKTSVIRIPTWIITLATPIVVSITVAIISYNVSFAKTAKQVEVNTKVLDAKVSTAEFELIQQQLNRIENKLDNHIAKE